MPKRIELEGMVFGWLTVIGPSRPKGAYWQCKCKCGKVFELPGKALYNGWNTSCGCRKTRRPDVENLVKKALSREDQTKDKPGFEWTEVKLRKTWRNMLHRCAENAPDRTRKNYFGRGICVADELKVFDNFLKVAREKLESAIAEYGTNNLQLDRIDNDKGYSESNIRFVPPWVNNKNCRANKANKLGLIGVHLIKSTGKYEAYTVVKGRKYWLGLHDDPEPAGRIRDEFIIRAGIVAVLNFPLSSYSDSVGYEEYKLLLGVTDDKEDRVGL